ncbi:MAG TPA: WXG100 family type VII secretion target [Propionibacterium sp.]|mgnify:FL=1|nr:WXG100 family type VII secretion target [Propionibacterium sp.]
MVNKSIDLTAMLRASRQVEAKHHQIHNLQNRLQAQMNDLASRWQGSGSPALQSGHRAFDTEFEKVKAGLDEIHHKLVEALNSAGATTRSTRRQPLGSMTSATLTQERT